MMIRHDASHEEFKGEASKMTLTYDFLCVDVFESPEIAKNHLELKSGVKLIILQEFSSHLKKTFKN